MSTPAPAGGDDASHAGPLRRADLRHTRLRRLQRPGHGRWLRKYYTINENWEAEDRRKLLAYARDLLNSDYAGHRLTFQLFAQSPPFAHLLAVYRNFDFAEPMRIVQKSAGLSEQVEGGRSGIRGSGSNSMARQRELRFSLRFPRSAKRHSERAFAQRHAT